MGCERIAHRLTAIQHNPAGPAYGSKDWLSLSVGHWRAKYSCSEGTGNRVVTRTTTSKL